MSSDATCDVAIAGGGPAGATAAYLLARSGFRVRLFEKHHFPRPKLCAGLLTWKTMDWLGRVFAAGPDDLMHMGIVTHTCRDYRIFFRGCEIARRRLDFPFHFVDRRRYDHHWLGMARSAGARIDTGVGVTRADPVRGRLTLADGRVVGAQIIIGADGVWSKVRDAVHPDRARKKRWRRHLAATVEAYRPLVGHPGPDDFASLHFGHAAWGYAWSFPGAGRRTLGLACLADRNKCSLHEAFEDFLESRDIDPAGLSPRQGYPLPYGNFLRRPAHRQALLAGDACGLADPLLGEGIFYAHRSAELAAQAIIDADGRWDRIASAYRRTLQKRVIRQLQWLGILRTLLFIGGHRRRYRGLKLLLRIFPKVLEDMVQGVR